MFSLAVSKNLFWDVDLTKFDDVRNRRLIIERVLSLGDFSDVRVIMQFYGLETIKEEIVQAGYLDNKTLAWVSNFLDIPKSKFKCYTKKQSNQAHWNY